MIITVGEHKYNARGKATYLAKEALQDILRRYYWLYAPSGYFAPDGSVSLVDSETDYEDYDNKILKKVPRTLTEAERDAMIKRAYANPDYQAEVLDFHLAPIGNAPILSQLIETYEPTDEEKAMIKAGELFFYANGIEKSLKKNESMNDTQGSPQEKEVTMQPNI